MLSLKEGEYAVRLAREAIEAKLKGSRRKRAEDAPACFRQRLGVFVTLETHPAHELRGCIGFPEPVGPLGDAIAEAAMLAATDDPRFQPVTAEEFANLVIEISVLTKPEEIVCFRPEDAVKEVKVGRDGLLIRKGFYSGLLLPQVPVEQKWNEQEFLAQACNKAGLPPDAWMGSGVKVFKFQAQIFSEEAPGGNVVEKSLE